MKVFLYLGPPGLKSVRVWQFNEFVSIKIPSQYLLTFLPDEIYRIIASTRAGPSGVPAGAFLS